MRILVALGIFSLSLFANAETQTNRFALCHNGTTTLSVLLEDGQVAADGATAGTLQLSKGTLDLPHWKPRQLQLADCEVKASFVPPFKDIPMNIQAFFIEGDPSPDVELDQLLKEGKAIPLRLNIICSTNEPTAGVTGCERVRILDKIIPIPNDGQPLRQGLGFFPSPSTSVVSLRSKVCGSNETTSSSAFVITHNGRKLIVASAGGISSEMGENSCTEALTSTGQIVPLKLLRLDWAYGLALLALPDGSDLPVANLNPTAGDSTLSLLTIDGSQTVSTDEAVLATKSLRHFIPLIARVLEIEGPALSANVVGAPLLGSDASVKAMVSHLHLRAYPGSLTRPTHWSKEHAIANHLVAISAADILKWLDRIDVSSLWLISQLHAEPLKFKSGHLLVSEKCPSNDTTIPNADYPIGGSGDGVGVGGDQSNYRACIMEISLDETSDSQFLIPRLQAWHDRTVAALRAGNRVEVPYGVLRDARGTLQRFYIYSAESFFQMLATESSVSPVSVYWNSDRTKAGNEIRLQPLRETAALAAAAAKTSYAYFTSSNPKDNAVIRLVYFYSTLSMSEEWPLLKPNDLQAMLDPNGEFGKSWEIIQEIVFGGKALFTRATDLLTEDSKVATP
jgi:hypothetical protein